MDDDDEGDGGLLRWRWKGEVGWAIMVCAGWCASTNNGRVVELNYGEENRRVFER